MAWWYEEEVILQMEVVSSYNTEKTVNKLYICMPGASRPASFMEKSFIKCFIHCKFVFPISNNQRSNEECGQCVKKVELCWSDVDF